MAHLNITAAGTYQVVAGACKEVLVSINAGWTGTLVVVDNTTGSTPLVATLTNPTAGGSPFQYRDFITGVRIITTGGTFGDVTVSANTGSVY